MFADAEQLVRERLAESPLGALAADELVVDLFCGAGGWTALKTVEVHAAVNHSPLAITYHRENHGACEHHEGDAWRTSPRSVTRGRPVGLLLASAACTTHSRARGAAPIAKRVHMLGWCIARWLKDESPRAFIVENVQEWQEWGPAVAKLDADGRPVLDANGRVMRTNCPNRKGSHFRKWLRYVKRLGYTVEYRVLDAVDFGAASRRKRLFVMGRRDGAPLVWPTEFHGCNGRGRVAPRHPPLQSRRPYRTAAEVIDWSDLGTSIFERKRPLKPKTLARIAEGIRRFVLNDPSPFVLRTTQAHAPGGGWHVASVKEVLRTQTTRQDLGVCTPLLARHNLGMVGHRVDQPLGTLTTIDQHSLVSPVLQAFRGNAAPKRADEPLPTITAGEGPGRGAGAGHSLGMISPLLATIGYGEREGQTPRCASVEAPLGTIVGDIKAGLVAPVMAYMNHGGKQTGRVDEPMRTVVAGGGHASLVAAFLVQYYSSGFNGTKPDQPLGAVVTKDRHGLVVVQLRGADGTLQPYVIVDILFRMLRPRELAAAMGFPAEYIWPKSQRDAVKLIGNAVSPPMGAALIGAMFPRGQKRRRAAA